jgi:hypothetical protein
MYTIAAFEAALSDFGTPEVLAMVASYLLTTRGRSGRLRQVL